MYYGLSPNSRTSYALDLGAKTRKKQSKGMQAPHGPTRRKKARPRQVPINFLSCFFIFNGKNFIGSLAFFPRLHLATSFLFFRFFLCGNGYKNTLKDGLTLT
jgi:hypothetical protein